MEKVLNKTDFCKKMILKRKIYQEKWGRKPHRMLKEKVEKGW